MLRRLLLVLSCRCRTDDRLFWLFLVSPSVVVARVSSIAAPQRLRYRDPHLACVTDIDGLISCHVQVHFARMDTDLNVLTILRLKEEVERDRHRTDSFRQRKIRRRRFDIRQMREKREELSRNRAFNASDADVQTFRMKLRK